MRTVYVRRVSRDAILDVVADAEGRGLTTTSPYFDLVSWCIGINVPEGRNDY